MIKIRCECGNELQVSEEVGGLMVQTGRWEEVPPPDLWDEVLQLLVSYQSPMAPTWCVSVRMFDWPRLREWPEER